MPDCPSRGCPDGSLSAVRIDRGVTIAVCSCCAKEVTIVNGAIVPQRTLEDWQARPEERED